MLTADLVLARKRGADLQLSRLDAKARARAVADADDLLRAHQAVVGRARDEVDAAIAEVVAAHDASPTVRRTLDGLRKLLDDEATWSGPGEDVDPAAVRRAVFVAASAARRATADDAWFDRDGVLASSGAAFGLTAEQTEQALYADLRAAQKLVSLPALSAEALVARWEAAQAQAVLLRAVRVVVHVACSSAGAVRALFRKLKFLRLLHEAQRLGEDEPWPERTTHKKRRSGHRITIDGPFSLFESVTKYGLKLALVLPALEECDAFHLEADVRWGPSRTPLTFRLDGGASRNTAAEQAPLPDEVATLVESFRGLAGHAWSVAPSPAILELPGIGLCVPDLLFEHPTGARVHLEVLGYWSREAVWRRVELVEGGLREPMLFAVSKRLRVREDVLDENLPSALYVYKGAMSARAVLERLEALRARALTAR